MTIPWGRLVPCSRNNEVLNNSTVQENGSNASNGGAMELLPRNPKEESRIPYNDIVNKKLALPFLGLKDLQASDKFNEYTIGRSQKCDFMVPKLQKNATNKDEGKHLSSAHSMVSNRHCTIFSMLKNVVQNSILSNEGVGMDVYLEDSSGNGTVINKTILLRRGQKRLLHTGDEICLINPAALRRIPSKELRLKILENYSYIFINLHQQQGFVQKKRLIQNLASPPRRKGIVDVRATNITSPPQKSSKSNQSHYLNAIMAIDQQQKEHKRKFAHSNDSNSPPIENSKRLRLHHPITGNRNVSRTQRIEEDYDLRDVLGSGTCGEVRRAIHRQTGEQRAVKIIKMSANGRNHTAIRLKETEKTLKAEAAILQSLNHPYIVKLIDSYVSQTAIYLVMEMLHGGDLFDRIVEKDRYSETESRRAMRRIFSAVYYLHEERDIVHRDLKPENILCVNRSSDIHIKLTDFGLAKNITEDGLKTFCGTPLYFAPEVLSRRNTVTGQGRYGKEADMWSLGVILYVLLSGRPPFDSNDYLNSSTNSKISFKSRRWETVSIEAKELVRLLLTVSPEKRIGIKEACNHKWILHPDGDTHTHPLHDPSLKSNSMNSMKENALFGAVMSKVTAKKEMSDQSRANTSFDKEVQNEEHSLNSHSNLPQSSPSPNAKKKALIGGICSPKVPPFEDSSLSDVNLEQKQQTDRQIFQNECDEIVQQITRPKAKVNHIQLAHVSDHKPSKKDVKEQKQQAHFKNERHGAEMELEEDKIESDFSEEEEKDTGKEISTSASNTNIEKNDDIDSDFSEHDDKGKERLIKAITSNDLGKTDSIESDFSEEDTNENKEKNSTTKLKPLQPATIKDDKVTLQKGIALKSKGESSNAMTGQTTLSTFFKKKDIRS